MGGGGDDVVVWVRYKVLSMKALRGLKIIGRQESGIC